MKELTVFTVADRSYEPFVLPYIASVLHHNPDARIEIGLENPYSFRRNNSKAIPLLQEAYGSRLAFQQPDFSRCPANTVRFISTPHLKSDHVYIGDIDILVLEEIAPTHLAQMQRSGLPFNNIIRPGSERLSGLHFSRWDAYYPINIKPEYVLSHDEPTLYRMVKDRDIGMPDPADTFRPLHGFHLSLNTDPRKVGWGGTRDPNLAASYASFRATQIWRDLEPLLDDRYRRILFVLDVFMAGRHPEIFADSPPAGDTKAGFVFI